MQAVMNIVVAVQGAKAAQAQLAAITAATKGANAATVAGAAAGGRLHGGLRTLTRGMEKYGKNMQWVGRQIEYNFTIPIAIASGFAIKFAMDNERAMVRLKKVYADSSMPTKQFTEETEALGRAFRFLSDQFGTAQDEVIESGATFAQAGAGNIAVARGVHAALELQILGDMELAEATEALIAVQAQYNVSSSELTQIIADLNAVENTTTVTLEDQITAMQRAAGVAREAGVGHQELSGMIASMVPAAAKANQAGNSLKTTITRIMAPTRQAKDAMEDLGIATDDMAWKNANATERFMILGEALKDVSAEQRTVALTHIAGRRQVSRLAVMLRDMTNEQGRYATALEATADPADSMLRKQREIDIFLRSGPQGFSILTQQIKNYAAEIGAQLMPTLLAVMVEIRDMARAFAELDPQTRKTILSVILLIAVVGPLVRIMGSTVLLITQFIKFFGTLVKGLWIGATAIAWVATKVWQLTKALWLLKEVPIWISLAFRQYLWVPLTKFATWLTATFWPAFKGVFVAMGGAIKTAALWVSRALIPAIIKGVSAAATAIAGLLGLVGWIIVAVVALGIAGWVFRDEIAEAFRSAGKWIGDVWNAVATHVGNIMRSIVDMVRDAVRAVVDLFAQMLNPFGGRQSRAAPNVTAPPVVGARAGGGNVVKGKTYLVGEEGPELWTAKDNGTIIPADVTAAMKAMSAGQASLGKFQKRVQPARDAMRDEELAGMRSDVTEWVPEAGPEFDRVVTGIKVLENQLSKVGAEYEEQERVVARWQSRLDSANASVDAHEDRLRSLQDAASDARDALRDAQDQLDEYANMPIEGMRAYEDQLFDNEQAQKRLRLEIMDIEDAHGPVEDLQRKLASLQGDIERMGAKREDLRLSGAGSDILGGYDEQIDQMKSAQSAIMDDAGTGPASQVAQLEKELAALQREAERTSLERDLEFDPLTRQIQRMVDGYKEMPFDEIVAAIKNQQKEVARLTKEYEAAEGAVEDQEAALDGAVAARDRIQASYDEEEKSLERLGDLYSDIENLISDMNSELEGFARAAAAAADAAAGGGAASLDDLLPEDWGDYEIPGGDTGLQWEEGDIDDLIAEWENEFGDLFGDFDLFAPVRELWENFNEWLRTKWESTWGWVKEKWTSFWEGIKAAPGNAWDSVKTTTSESWESVKTTFSEAWTSIKTTTSEAWGTIKTTFSEAWTSIKTGVSEAWETIKGYFATPMAWLKEQWNKFWNTEIGQELALTLAQWKIWITEAWDAITSYLSEKWGEIKIKATEIWGSIKTFFFDTLEAIRTKTVEVWDGISTWFSERWEAIRITIKEKWNAIKTFFFEFWTPIETKIRSIWESISTFLSGKWERITSTGRRIWDAFKGYVSRLLERVKGFFSGAWTAIKTAASIAWGLIKGVIVGVLRVLRGDVSGAIDRVREAVKEAWDRIKALTAEVWGKVRDAVSDKIEAMKKVVRRGRDAIGRIWDGIKSKLRTPIVWAVDNIINPLIRGINKVAKKVGLSGFSEITIPAFHEGGVVGKGGKPRKLGQHPIQSDEQLSLLQNGERVLTKAERDYFEGDPQAMLPEVGGIFDVFKSVATSAADGIRSLIASTVRPIIDGAMDAIGSIAGGDTGFGEIIKSVARYIGDGVVDWIAGIEREMPKEPELGTGVGYRKMWSAVKDQFDFARLTSGYRFGAITATGRPSYHAQGRAVDLAGQGFMNQNQMLSINKWIYDNYKAQTKELIYSGPNSQQVRNGRDAYYTGVTRGNHWDHVHWAMDNGGLLDQGWNQPIFNGTGQPEIVSPERLMRRIVREEVQRSDGGDRNITFTGDLSFPNVKDGTDAEDFVRNLETMVGA